MTASTPASLAKLDQDLAPVNAMLDRLLPGIREQIAESGEVQGFANLALMVSQYAGGDLKDSLLLAAIWRLARQPAAIQTAGGPS